MAGAAAAALGEDQGADRARPHQPVGRQHPDDSGRGGHAGFRGPRVRLQRRLAAPPARAHPLGRGHQRRNHRHRHAGRQARVRRRIDAPTDARCAGIGRDLGACFADRGHLPRIPVRRRAERDVGARVAPQRRRQARTAGGRA